MADERNVQDEVIEEVDPTVHHEDRDINVRAVLLFAGIFVVLSVVMYVGLWYLLEGFRLWERSREMTPVTEVETSYERQIPPEPRLQPFPEPRPPGTLSASAEGRAKQEEPTIERNFANPWEVTPAADWREYRAMYDKRVNSYGWIDRQRGIVHVPVSEAKRLLLRQGLASRSTIPEAAAAAATEDADLTTPEATPAPAVPSMESQPGQPTPGPTSGGEEPLEVDEQRKVQGEEPDPS